MFNCRWLLFNYCAMRTYSS